MAASPERGFVDVLVGGQYGSEGKGQISAFLAPEYDLLVRVGGPNAGHTVFAEPDRHTFHHLPSGTMSSSAELVLGAGAVLLLPTLQEEIERYSVTGERLHIDPSAMVIEDEDRAFEISTLKEQIGSTAQGVGRATSRKILRTAAEPAVRLARDVPALEPYVRPTLPVLISILASGGRVFLEGTQGTGLSLHHGQYPHVTSRDTTAAGCLAEAGIAPAYVRRIIMVCRTYPIRVQSPAGGTSGTLINEIDFDVISQRSGVPLEELQRTETTTTTRRKRRIGEFDWELLKRSAALNGPTDIALTFVDYLSVENRQATRLADLGDSAIRLVERIEEVVGVPVSLLSTRFHRNGVIDRRDW